MANRLLLHERHVAAGARFVTVCDWDLPADYGDASAEYAAARRGVALADRGDWGVLDVTGRDRATFLHALLSNEIKALQPGQGCTAALLDVHGKVQVILTVWVLEDRIRLVMPRGLTAKISESLRIEAGTPLFGHDVDESVLLPEIPLERLASYTKGCYPGQEVVVRIRDRGHVNRRLTGLVLEGEVVPPHAAEVLADGAAVGRVTSGARWPGLGRPIGLALVRREHAEPDRAVTVRVGEGAVPARVAALPFAR